MERELSPYQQNFVDRIRAMPVIEEPFGWKLVGKIGVGGLVAVGFDEESDSLLVVSHSGRGLFSCETGKRLERDPDSSYEWLNISELAAEGIGAASGRKVPLAGIYGGGLHHITFDDWSVECVWPDWPDGDVILNAPGSGIYQKERAAGCTKIAEVEELRAYGFSRDGSILVVAQSHTLKIWRRFLE